MGKTESIIRRFPDFCKSDDPGTLFYQFIKVFGQILDDAESDLVKVMRSHWVNSADNEGSKGFNTAQKGDLDRIFSLYLENLGGTSQLKQGERDQAADDPDAIYRERIKGLINVLKNGASTRQGIIAIVAANLGIVEGKAGYEEALNQIRIEEFLPEVCITGVYTEALYESFIVENTNAVEVVPEIRIQIRDDIPAPLVNPGIRNKSTGQSVYYEGTLVKGDVLSFFPDGSAFLNGVLTTVTGTTPSLPPGKSAWCFEAFLGLGKGLYDKTPFDYSLFEKSDLRCIGVFDLGTSKFDEAVFALDDPVAGINLSFIKLTPASFKVRIPWDIPGFTEPFDNLAENPRHQIKYIVDKVKAAGVFAVVSYEKHFSEEQDMEARYAAVKVSPLRENHGMEEGNFDLGSMHIPYPAGIEHHVTDRLITSGMFDYTGFDTLNTFI